MTRVDILAEQARYYRERAPEYDDWWFRRGRYDLGPEENARWVAQTAEVEQALDRFRPSGDVLELACGTGIWTRHLVRRAARVTAVDASPEMIELNRARLGDAPVDYVQADLFAWRPQTAYDVCFFSFWLSHVPESRFNGFWRLVDAALRLEGRVFLVDSNRGESAHTEPGEGADRELRRLSDGREFEIVKRYYEPAALERRLAALGWRFELSVTAAGGLVYGFGRRA